MAKTEVIVRDAAYRSWLSQPPMERIKNSLTGPRTVLIDARCGNLDCPSQGIIYAAHDLTEFTPQELRFLNGKKPVIGPCPTCHSFDNEAIKNGDGNL